VSAGFRRQNGDRRPGSASGIFASNFSVARVRHAFCESRASCLPRFILRCRITWRDPQMSVVRVTSISAGVSILVGDLVELDRFVLIKLDLHRRTRARCIITD